MGDRAHIKFDFGSSHDGKADLSPLYLYTHWHGSALAGMAEAACQSEAAQGRKGDAAYFARIVLSHILNAANEGLGTEADRGTGWGISTTKEHIDCGDHGQVGTVDCLRGEFIPGPDDHAAAGLY
jgi:hypothetical protein